MLNIKYNRNNNGVANYQKTNKYGKYGWEKKLILRIRARRNIGIQYVKIKNMFMYC